QSASSSGPVPPQPPIYPPIYPPAQTQEPTGVPVIPINSFSEPQMTPEQVDQVQRDFFGEAFSGRPRRDPSQQDEPVRRIATGVTAQ
ncbi:MAG: hypothetical protein ACKPKO_63855, partial [Candidatus Fonsibacter sp.]